MRVFATIVFAGLLFAAPALSAPTTPHPAPTVPAVAVPVVAVPAVPVAVVTTPPPTTEVPPTTPAPVTAPLFNLTDTLFRLSNRTDRAREHLIHLQEVFSKSGLSGVAKEIGLIASHPVEDSFLLLPASTAAAVFQQQAPLTVAFAKSSELEADEEPAQVEEIGREDDDQEADGTQMDKPDNDDEISRKMNDEEDHDRDLMHISDEISRDDGNTDSAGGSMEVDQLDQGDGQDTKPGLDSDQSGEAARQDQGDGSGTRPGLDSADN